MGAPPAAASGDGLGSLYLPECRQGPQYNCIAMVQVQAVPPQNSRVRAGRAGAGAEWSPISARQGDLAECTVQYLLLNVCRIRVCIPEHTLVIAGQCGESCEACTPEAEHAAHWLCDGCVRVTSGHHGTRWWHTHGTGSRQG